MKIVDIVNPQSYLLLLFQCIILFENRSLNEALSSFARLVKSNKEILIWIDDQYDYVPLHYRVTINEGYTPHDNWIVFLEHLGIGLVVIARPQELLRDKLSSQCISDNICTFW